MPYLPLSPSAGNYSLARTHPDFLGEGSIDLTSGPWVLMLAESVLFPTELQFLMDELVYSGGLSSR